ncbi:MAG: hypothetical protein LBL55_10650 [Propionibacteriaceae bacterium]|nr:hypothetical protein [Propionibacteriaceae bacterium]
MAPLYHDPAWPSVAPPVPYYPPLNRAAPQSNTVGVVALILSILVALAAAGFGFGLIRSATDGGYGGGYIDYFSLPNQLNLFFSGLSLLGFTSLILGIVAASTNRGRPQGVIAIIVSLVAPVIAVLAMVMGLSLALA